MNLLNSDILGKINEISINTIAYETYEHKVINDVDYLFGVGNFVSKKYYKTIKDGRVLLRQIVTDNKILLDLLKFANTINKGQFKSFKNFTGELIDVVLEEEIPASAKSMETLDKQTVKLVIKFCETYGVIYESCIIEDDEVSDNINIDFDDALDNGARFGFKVNEFLALANDIYTIFKNWELWKNSSTEFKQNEIYRHKHRDFYGFLSVFIDHLNRMPNRITSEIFFSPKNNSFKEVLSVSSLSSLIVYQLRALITENINVKKCENKNCYSYFTGRENQRFCSTACKQQDYRNNKKCNFIDVKEKSE